MKNKIIVAIFVLLLIGVGLFVYFGQKEEQQSELFYSGTIEATHAELAFQVSGKVAAVRIREGQAVGQNQVLAELDPADYQARLNQANAIHESALRTVGQLQANLSVLKRTLPADVSKADAGLTTARVSLEDARKDKERYDQLFQRGVVSQKEWETMRLRYDTAAAKMEEAKATSRQAQSSLTRIESVEKEIEAARAQVKSAKAAAEQTELQLRYSKLTAPFNGVITSRNVEPGEVVTPSRQVLTLSDLATVDLKIFVGETEIGKVKPGQKAEVRVDTFPGKTYPGTVSFISPEGEFTPKVIQTHKERVKLVYLVKISIPNPRLELKSGMPADAWLR